MEPQSNSLDEFTSGLNRPIDNRSSFPYERNSEIIQGVTLSNCVNTGLVPPRMSEESDTSETEESRFGN